MIVIFFFIILKANMTYILYTNDAQATTTNSTENNAMHASMLAYTELLL